MRILCLSDTHGYHERLPIDETVDVIVHTGDFSNSYGKNNIYETEEFLSWFNSLNVKYKILVAGNHDTYFEELSKKGGINAVKDYLSVDYSNIIYLQDSGISINGINFYGAPWCPIYYDWAFMVDDDYQKMMFSKIPEDTNILLTHTPAYGILDYSNGKLCGSTPLLNRIQEIKSLGNLKYHIFGHIHMDDGNSKEHVGNNEKTDYIAVNACNINYLGFYEPIIIEI